MEEADKSIKKSVESGDYYKDAMSWYLFKYVTPVIDKTILSVMIGLISICLLVFLYFYTSMVTVNSQVEFVVSNKDINEYYTIIKPIGEENQDPRQAVKEYLIKKYILSREGYNYQNFEKNKMFVIRNSTPSEQEAYLAYSSVNNPKSPLILYQMRYDREIDIKELSFNAENTNTITVKFDARVILKHKNTSQKTSWVARIDFDIDDSQEAMQNNASNLSFRVKSYLVKQIM